MHQLLLTMFPIRSSISCDVTYKTTFVMIHSEETCGGWGISNEWEVYAHAICPMRTIFLCDKLERKV
jgi:hypothetical protein